MPVSWTCEVRPGIRFEVMGGFMGFGPSVLIPVAHMDAFTDEELCTAVRSLSTEALEIDHVIAIANGGTNALDNLRFLCQSCNGAKSDKE